MTLFQFLTIFDDLKQVLRTGWLLRGVPPSRAENVAAHSHTTAILAYLLALQTKESVDLHQVLLMALIHDAPEAVIGDIPMSDNAMNQILTYLPAELQPTVSEAWSAYRKRTSLEARLVEAADRLATALHAAQLVKSGFPVEQFQPFIDHAEKTVEALHIPQAKDFIKELREVFPQKL
jgi:putative hydrolase of HD superfamily